MIGLRELCGNKPLDLPSQIEAQHSDQNNICERLDKNNRFRSQTKIHWTFNKKFVITSIQPVFIDHSGFVIWLLDKDDNMYEWNKMQHGKKSYR